MWPPGCIPLVLPPSQNVSSAWASLSLVGCRYTSKGVFQRNPVLTGHLKTYGHNAFQILHIHTTVINSGRTHTTVINSGRTHTTVIKSGRTHTTQHCTHCELWLWLQSRLMLQSPHRLWNDLKCVEWDVKPCPSQSNTDDYVISMDHIPDNTSLSPHSGACVWQTSWRTLVPLGCLERRPSC